MNLLYIEDNLPLAQTVRTKLMSMFNVDLAHTSSEGLKMAEDTEYDVILIDYYLPDISGLELCKLIRETNNDSVIVFLTNNTSKRDLIEAMEHGADDFMTKPFSFGELRVRIQSVIRRKYSNKVSDELVAGDFRLNPRTREVFFGKQPIDLKRKEFLLLEYFMLHQGQVISRSRLYEHIWNQQYYSSNTIDVHIRRLRAKIELPFGVRAIHTIYGSGYRFKYWEFD